MSTVAFDRQLGESEVAYYLPSRANGVNDMCVHIEFDAPESMMERKRVLAAWAIMRVRHPLLASKVVMKGYTDIRFVYEPPVDVSSAMKSADESLIYTTRPKDEILESYINGPRTLSDNRLSYLGISKPNPRVPCQHELFIAATHFLGDSMALHAFINDLLILLGSEKVQEDLNALLDVEWRARCGPLFNADQDILVLPTAMEVNFARPESKLRRVVAKVDFKNSQEELIGAQTFPRVKGARRMVVPTISFDPQRTKRILESCKTHGVSISAAMFAICNLAWARITDKPELPMMMYSALDVRPCFDVKPIHDSYWYLALGYFNVVLPTFLPSNKQATTSTFWHRARLAKQQCKRAAKSPMAISRILEMAAERGGRARVWAKVDDDKDAGIPPSPKSPAFIPASPPRRAPAPSLALVGLSLWGSLDGIYIHASYPEIKLHTLAGLTRQREGGMLVSSYTFAGRLSISLAHDANGFEKATVDRFWKGMVDGIDEMLGSSTSSDRPTEYLRAHL